MASLSFFPFMPALGGACVYGLFQWVFRKPIFLYVVGHELSHALAAYLSGHRVKSFSVSSKGGEVVLSGSNVWVALAPYCIPIYTGLLVAGLALVQRFTDLNVPPWLGASAIGFSFAFHVSLTVFALRQHQPDLRYVGPFLSLVLIFLINGLIFVVLLKLLWPRGVSLTTFGTEVLVIWKNLLGDLWGFFQMGWTRLTL